LKARSLSGVRLIISDDHKGLKKAVDKHFQGAVWQRCNFHFIRNLLDTVPRSKRKYTYSDLKTIFSSPQKAEALARSAEVTKKYEKSYPRFVEKLEAGILDSLSYMDFPIEHWSRIRTTNLVERLNAEIKRRTDVIRIFPNLASAERLLCALAIEQNEEWITGRKYLNMEYLKNYSQLKSNVVKDKDKVLVALT
jgi:putative transposase